jgi:hypothetical protein
MKEVKALRYAFVSMALLVLAVLFLFLIFKTNKIGRDDAMIAELFFIVLVMALNFFKMDSYLKRYSDVKAFFNFMSFASIVALIVAYNYDVVLFYYVSGVTFASVMLTIVLWVKDLRRAL